MNPSEILELVRAGYTKEEINQMTAPAPAPVPEPGPEPVPEPVPEPEPVHTDPEPVLTPTDPEPTIRDVLQGIAKLTSAIQANAIAHSIVPGGNPGAPRAEDALAEIIRPTYKERG